MKRAEPDWLPKASARFWRQHARRAKGIRLEVIGDWDRFQLFDGSTCVLDWKEGELRGNNVDWWITFELMPMIKHLAHLMEREPPSRPNILGNIILEEAAKLAGKKRKLHPRYFDGIVHRNVLRVIERREVEDPRWPNHLRGQKATVTPQYVGRVLRHNGYPRPPTKSAR